jgi:drug/metabolite transporter (DMT)-like permease
MMLNKLAPFFTVAFSWVFLGERLRLAQGACLAGALLGAACVVKPGFAAVSMFPALCGLAGGISAGGAYACVHALGRRQVDPRLIVLFFSAFSCLAAVPFMVADFAPMTLPQVGALIGAGATAAMGQFGVTAAYRFAEPRSIAAWDYTNILFAALFGLLLFGQIPDAWSVLGFVAIVVSALMLKRA